MCRVNASVADYCSSAILENTTRAPDLLASAEHRNFEVRAVSHVDRVLGEGKEREGM